MKLAAALRRVSAQGHVVGGSIRWPHHLGAHGLHLGGQFTVHIQPCHLVGTIEHGYRVVPLIGLDIDADVLVPAGVQFKGRFDLEHSHGEAAGFFIGTQVRLAFARQVTVVPKYAFNREGISHRSILITKRVLNGIVTIKSHGVPNGTL